MNDEYPYLRKYSNFILSHHLDSMVADSIQLAKELKLPILNRLAHLNEDQLFQASKKGFSEDILIPLVENNPFYMVKESISNWKADMIVIPKDQISVHDIIDIYNVRKLSLISMLKWYDYTKEEGIELHKEIENYFTICITFGYQAAEEIQKGALKESQEILNGILSNIPVIVTRINRQGNILQSLGCGLEMLGFKDGGLIGSNIFADYPNAHYTRKAIDGEKVFFQGSAKSKTGAIRYYQSYFFPEKGGAIGFSMDITEQKIAEAMLKEREYFIEQVADSTPFIIQVFDKANNTNIYSNKGLENLLGYTAFKIIEFNDILGYQLVHPSDVEKLKERNRNIETAKDGELIETEIRIKDVQNGYRWILTRSTVFKRTTEGTVEHILNTYIDTTEKKLVEEKLQQQLRIFDTALSNTDDYNYIFDLQGNFIYANQPLLDLWGKSKEEAIGKSFIDLPYSRQQAELFQQQILNVIETKKPFKGENEYTTYTGKVGYFQYTFLPVFGSNNEVEAVAGTTHDITDVKSTAEKQYRSIFESSNDAILIYDQEGQLVEVNAAGYIMHGYTYEEMIGKNGKDFIDINDHEKFLAFIDVVKEGRQYSASLKHIRSNGNIIFVIKTGTVFTFKGRPHLLAVVHDVTEKKEAEEALRESEDRFRTLADNIPNLTWIANADGWITWYNKRWYEYTGTSPEQMEGWGWQSVHDPQELPKVLDGWTSSIQNGNPFEMVFPLKGADEVFRPFLTRVVPIRNKENKIIRWFGTNTDITQHIKAEEVLEKKNKELMKINNDLDNFIYTASHDLKSPVSNLEGLISLFDDEEERLITAQGKDIMPLVGQSLNRLKTVIKELTHIASIQKETETEDEEIVLEDFIEEIFNSLQDQIIKYNGSIVCDFSHAPKIRFSKKNLRSILYNLVSNAIKYSDKAREGLVHLSTEKQGGQMILSVRDNGLGIPEKQKDKVFTMFKRLHTHVEGSGIGLYIVKRIIENAGGKIEVETQVGKGTTFKVFFNL